MVTPPARLHHGGNTAAMGVRARQFRTADRFIADSASSNSDAQKTRCRDVAPFYCGEPMQTATKGVFAALGTGPHEAPLSLGN